MQRNQGKEYTLYFCEKTGKIGYNKSKKEIERMKKIICNVFRRNIDGL